MLFRNARARNTHVEATLNLSCPAQALAGRPRFRDVVLAPGDALYMPCGFWHEVSSDGGVHAAFNYWLHPPDAADFARPYASPFWTDDWARRERDDAFVRAALKRRR
jgi:ribosomal protein L16 Arg81 hydroxylase